MAPRVGPREPFENKWDQIKTGLIFKLEPAILMREKDI